MGMYGTVPCGNDVVAVAFSLAGCFPEFKTREELLKDSTVVFTSSRIADRSGGMEEDPEVIARYNQIKLMIASWKKGDEGIQRYKNWE